MEGKKTFQSAKDFIEHYYDEMLRIFNCVNVGIFIADSQGKIIMVNNESEKTGGLRRDELIGRNMKDLMAEGYVEESATLKTIASGKEEHIVQKLSDGSQLYITGIPLIEDSDLKLVFCIERDITETIKLRELLSEKEQVTRKYETELEYLRRQNASFDEDMIIGSGEMEGIVEMALRIAKIDTTVLITGESGTGKEVLANLIYKNSSRQNGPFIKINCAAIPENLMESEFFGYEKGAFTGANTQGKAGFFELANEGTLFLDEIAELPYQMQSKLLRAIQEKEIVHIGGKTPIPINIRIIAATNANLKNAMKEGKFREDLFYRLNIIPIEIPPLRDRRNDIKRLAISFIDQFNKKYKVNRFIEEEAIEILNIYKWPGNIRELKNIIERIIVTTDNDRITAGQVGNLLHVNVVPLNPEDKYGNNSLQDQVEDFERNLLKDMLGNYENATEIAKALKVNKSTISKKFKKYSLK